MTELTCPKCEHVFEVEDYESGYCPGCNITYYYWDSVFNEEDGVEYFEGFYWG
jgi:hypothetical protein